MVPLPSEFGYYQTEGKDWEEVIYYTSPCVHPLILIKTALNGRNIGRRNL
jgi:hypothetical protein